MDFLAGSNKSLFIILIFFVSAIVQSRAETKVCFSKSSPCFLKKIGCPAQCPSSSPTDPKVKKVCVINCNSPICKAECRSKIDPKSYTNPEIFEPERFLNNTIDYKGNDFELIPFGGGRRICPAIQFAIAVKEIALANIVHKFDWALPDGARPEDLDMTESAGSSVHRKYPLKAVATPYFGCI